eukprot:TRINITY_DN2971_c0_g2_i1.p2 TRINITY_DN2971_c0_g2~~TRINITY_DN2971_c0_g2_i1.p2  ORF type:complete len:248 (+),score=59.33 TRINITY_DN2971_c0_g2_i1:1841-2584(+)
MMEQEYEREWAAEGHTNPPAFDAFGCYARDAMDIDQDSQDNATADSAELLDLEYPSRHLSPERQHEQHQLHGDADELHSDHETTAARRHHDVGLTVPAPTHKPIRSTLSKRHPFGTQGTQLTLEQTANPPVRQQEPQLLLHSERNASTSPEHSSADSHRSQHSQHGGHYDHHHHHIHQHQSHHHNRRRRDKEDPLMAIKRNKAAMQDGLQQNADPLTRTWTGAAIAPGEEAQETVVLHALADLARGV